MICIDTNVLVRVLVDDDQRQADAAAELLGSLSESKRGFITLTSVVELHWVLRKSFLLEDSEVSRLFDALMATSELEIEDGESVGEALEQARRGADFADALIDATARLYGMEETVTFDRQAARRFGWRLLA